MLRTAGCRARRKVCEFWAGKAMSLTAIAAAMACDGLSVGERLVAFSLASFADRENRAWPGAPAAAARAGLSRGHYLQARDQLVRRGLVVVEDRASGRGRASTVSLTFADRGPWTDGDINAPLFEATLSYSRSRGPARLLLASIAALADQDGLVAGHATGQLCGAAGLADRSYRRARQALLASGELVLLSGGGGRGNVNHWQIPDPRARAGEQPRPATGRRVPPPAGARPLMASVEMSIAAATSQETSAALDDVGPSLVAENPGQDRTLSPQNCPIVTGVYERKGGQDQTVLPRNCPIVTGVSAVNPGQDLTLFAQTPAQTPAAIARTGREPQNPKTKQQPPNPPGDERSNSSIQVEETFITARGRKRRRQVNVSLEEVRRTLGAPGAVDHADWGKIRTLVADAVGQTMFEVWFEPVKLIAIDPDGALVLDAPLTSRSWLLERFSTVMADVGVRAGRAMRIASAAQSAAMGGS
jgi:hypothetical protein